MSTTHSSSRALSSLVVVALGALGAGCGHGTYLTDRQGCLIVPHTVEVHASSPWPKLMVYQRECEGDKRATTNVTILTGERSSGDTLPAGPGNVFVAESADPAAKPSKEGPWAIAFFVESTAVTVVYDSRARVLKRDSVVLGSRIRYKADSTLASRPDI